MAYAFRLPEIGEGVVEGEIVQWLVKPGDAVEYDQPMLEVMTDKATVVVGSPVKGKVLKIEGTEGDTVEVHSVIATLEVEGETPSEGPGSMPDDARKNQPGSADSTPTPAPEPGPARPKALAAPATRRLARELGVDLALVEGTGPGGRVLSEDVRRAAESTGADTTVPDTETAAPAPKEPAAARPPAPSIESEADTRIPVRGLRRRIWDNMARSMSTAAHFTFVEECDATELVQIRQRFNRQRNDGEPKLTFLPFIAKAVAVALRRAPHLNGQIDEGELEFVQRGPIHLGVAVSSERGLTVPVVRHADRRSLLDLAREIQRLSDAVRSQSLGPEDLGGSTFTITSLGKDGGLMATPVINHPEVAILGVHRLRREPKVGPEDEIRIRDVMNLSLSFDHRWVDGHVGAAFTYHVIDLLQRPDRLWMEMT
jgi:pyruvate dehydrogenase E2 component (dihydrolipoamide acetyltransferase)